MKRTLLIFMIIFNSTKSNSQSYVGFNFDNFSGIHSAISNPANIVDSKFKTDINLISISAFANNDFYGVNAKEIFKKNSNIDDSATTNPLKLNNGRTNFDIMGPSVMFNIFPKHSIGIITRGRGFMDASLSGPIYSDIAKYNFDDDTLPIDAKYAPDQIININAWTQIGITYGVVLFQKNEHFLKGGATFNYLYGVKTQRLKIRNLGYRYEPNTDDLKKSLIITSGELTTTDRYFQNSDDFSKPDEGRGFSGDFGLIYEYRPNYENGNKKYKYKFGISVTDLGKIKYPNIKEAVFDLNKTYSRSTTIEAARLSYKNFIFFIHLIKI